MNGIALAFGLACLAQSVIRVSDPGVDRESGFGSGSLVAPPDVAADRCALLGVAAVVGAVEGEVADCGELGLNPVQPGRAKAGLALEDIDLIEVNEAFAALPLVTTLALVGGDRGEALRLRERTNVNGGAVAVGHPTGATGGRLVMTMINELRRRGGGRGLVAICGGVGEAESAIITVR